MKKEIRHSTNIKDTPFIDQWLESLDLEKYELIKEHYNKGNKNGI
jgi:hypothetical protein